MAKECAVLEVMWDNGIETYYLLNPPLTAKVAKRRGLELLTDGNYGMIRHREIAGDDADMPGREVINAYDFGQTSPCEMEFNQPGSILKQVQGLPMRELWRNYPDGELYYKSGDLHLIMDSLLKKERYKVINYDVKHQRGDLPGSENHFL